MKKKTRLLSLLLCCVLLLGLLPVTALADAGDVEINDTNFPDANFQSYVRAFDENGDGVLSAAEIAAVTEIECSWGNIASLKGIEYFTALTYLDCGYNDLTSLDVSGNTALSYLDCGENPLTSLIIGGNTALTYLYCGDTQLTSLDVSGCTALTELYCCYTRLTSLNIGSNPALTYLYCGKNQLTSLDLGGCPALTDLDCGENEVQIAVSEDRTFDLSTLPEGFEISKASDWRGGTVDGTILTFDPDCDTVTYLYDTGNRQAPFWRFTLSLPHSHDYIQKWDEVGHWLECDCGEIKDMERHTFGEWTVTKPSTHTEPGEQQRTCTVCGYAQTNVIWYSNDCGTYTQKWDKLGHWLECDCGVKKDAAPHAYGDWMVTKPASTTETGEEQRVCAVCGYTQSAEIPMVVTPPTSDGANVLLWAILMFTGTMGVAVTAVCGRKK